MKSIKALRKHTVDVLFKVITGSKKLVTSQINNSNTEVLRYENPETITAVVENIPDVRINAAVKTLYDILSSG